MNWIVALLFTTGCSNLLGLDDYDDETAAASGAGGSGGEAVVGGAGGSPLVQCNGNLILRDHFERSVSVGWGEPDEGMDWTDNSDGTSVSEGTGVIHVPGDGAATLVPDTVKDIEMVGLVRWAIPSGPFTAVYGGLLVRATFTHYIQVNISNTQGQSELVAAYNTPVTSTTLAAEELPTPSWSGDGYFFRVHVFGESPSRVRVRVWAHGEAEPPQWHIDVTNRNADLPLGGGYGAQLYTEGNADGITAFFDDFSVCTL